MRIDGVIAQFTDLDANEVTLWIEQGWIKPEKDGPELEAIDIARIRLIYDLQRSCGIDQALIPLVLSLLDQVYDLRFSLKAICAAVEAQPASVRKKIDRSIAEYRRKVMPETTSSRH